MPRRILSLLATIMVIAAAAGCDDGGRRETPPSPDVRPVTDRSPYLCDLVPEPGFRRSTGLTTPLKSDWDGPQTDNGLCLARPSKGPAPLGIEWSYNGGEEILRTQRKNWAHGAARQLPSELGRGLAGYRSSGGLDGLPNYVVAVFKCGRKKPWISIDFVNVVRGRDAVQDMVDFMRIAEKRFGEIHKCEPRPS